MPMVDDQTETILVIDDTPTNLRVVSAFLEEAGYRVLVAEDGNDAKDVICQRSPDLILLDVLMPGPNGYETCLELKSSPKTRDIPVIFMTALSETSEKVKGFQVGGVDYITKPFQQEEVLARVKTHLVLRKLRSQLEAKNRQLEEQNHLLREEINAHSRTKETVHYLQNELDSQQMGGGVIGQSPSIRKTLEQVAQAAETDCTILIIGETGTGKELLARTIHEQSPRANMPMIKVNCAAIPKNLFESEFFGHEKGSFTGASGKRMGRFELADGGTLFLDEIGELPLDIQAKLLRVLQEQEFERIGSQTTQKVNVRIIVATNRDLQTEVANKQFREDLYYRLNVFPVHLPPLRERQEDLPLLLDYMLKKYSVKHGKVIEHIPPDTHHELLHYSWPGNIRELENVIERAVVITKGNTLQVGPWIRTQPTTSNPHHLSNTQLDTAIIEPLETMERAHILRALEATKWRISGEKGAAELLGLNRSTLRSRMEKLGISREE